MRAKKSLGQHFLTNPQIAQRIVEALPKSSEVQQIVEVGPGRGILTQFLLEREEDLILIEKDRELIPVLNEAFMGKDFQLVEIDFLKSDLGKLTAADFHLIGNFPYNISSQIVFKMLDHKQHIKYMVGMFQKEVAQRLVAIHGNKQYGILSVLVQAFYDVEICMHLEPGAFSPPPKVKSAVIRCSRHGRIDMDIETERFFRKVVKSAFNQRRKMLRNSLKTILEETANPEEIESYLTLRPEQISVRDFVELARSLHSKKK